MNSASCIICDHPGHFFSATLIDPAYVLGWSPSRTVCLCDDCTLSADRTIPGHWKVKLDDGRAIILQR